MKKQTAVEWLVDKLSLLNLDIHLHSEKYNVDEAIREKNKILQQAKAMEKEQIVDAYDEAFLKAWEDSGQEYYHTTRRQDNGEQFFNETYGGDK
jgi:hypothetical protein